GMRRIGASGKPKDGGETPRKSTGRGSRASSRGPTGATRLPPGAGLLAILIGPAKWRYTKRHAQAPGCLPRPAARRRRVLDGRRSRVAGRPHAARGADQPDRLDRAAVAPAVVVAHQRGDSGGVVKA